MKLIIAGSREFNDYNLLKESYQKISQSITEIVSGKARGADKLGEKLAKELGIPIKPFPADWNKYGKSAGYRRNAEMAKYGDILLLMWDGESKGSKHMLDLAKKEGLVCYVEIFK